MTRNSAALGPPLSLHLWHISWGAQHPRSARNEEKRRQGGGEGVTPR
ncbi:hypothetical protein CZ774_16565 [Frigoribacterium sp. JB110]|nr:hypothetical protein CZ774_16565 [Frigoribacterium sp. JB110]